MEQSSTEAMANRGLPEDVADAWAAVVLDILEKEGQAEPTNSAALTDTGEPSCRPAI